MILARPHRPGTDGRFEVSYGHYILGPVRRMIVWERGAREEDRLHLQHDTL